VCEQSQRTSALQVQDQQGHSAAAIGRDKRRNCCEGKTELLKDFVSAKSGRSFHAFLVLGEDGKVNFEFPPREAETHKSLVK